MPAADLGSSYTAAFLTYLADGDERARRAAYELGRRAVGAGLGMMDVADVHHQAVAAALQRGAPPEAATRAAGDFLLETLSAFEMVQRGLGEALEAVERERRHGTIVRQLSAFLGDASLALSARESLHEVLHLLAEQARELIGAACCVATVSYGHGAPARAASYAEGDTVLGARLALGDLSHLEALVAAHGPAARLDPKEVFADGRAGLDDVADRVRSWLAVSLTRLDGRAIGCIHLFDRRPRAFTSEDEALLLHLAQMGSAAVERVALYAEDPARPDHGASVRRFGPST